MGLRYWTRLFGLGRRILLSNFRRSPVPFKLTFILTYRCDCRCRMCNIWERKVENELGSWFDVLPVLDEASTGTEIDEVYVSSALGVAGKSSLQHKPRITPASDGPLLVHNSPL